jgi:hypothetical protein
MTALLTMQRVIERVVWLMEKLVAPMARPAVELRLKKMVLESRVLLMTMESVVVLRTWGVLRGLQQKKRVVLLVLRTRVRSALVQELVRVLLECLMPTVPAEHLLWVLARP